MNHAASSTRTRSLAKPLAFPKVHSFGDLFDVVSERKEDVPEYVWNATDSDGRKMRIPVGPFTIVDPPRHVIYVHPNARLIAWVESNMLMLDRDSLYFQVNKWDAQRALVSIRHNLIIGDRWLAVVNPRTIRAKGRKRASSSANQAGRRASGFDRWLNTFLSEKGIDSEEVLEVQGPSGTNWIPVGVLVSMIKQAPAHEQAGIKTMLVKIDFRNGDVRDYLRHLAKAVAK